MLGRRLKTSEVVVDRQMLRDYVTDYHHNSPRNRCKADGQDWPCDVYKHLREAIDNG